MAHSRRASLRGLLASLVIVMSVLAILPLAQPARGADEPHLFLETGYAVANGAFWDYFQSHGGVATLGFPISRPFTLLGAQVQVFQRVLLRLQPNGSVVAMDLLDSALPYSQIAYAYYPPHDAELVAQIPPPDAPNYDAAIADLVRSTVPDELDGNPLGFYQAYVGTAASLGGSEDERLRMAADVWGAPTSRPAYDRNNASVVYQRFQRGILRYGLDCGCTQAVNVADYFKALLTGESLPDDLAMEAAESPFIRQYAPGLPGSIARPEQLPDSDLTDAFAKAVAPVVAAGPYGTQSGSSATYPALGSPSNASGPAGGGSGVSAPNAGAIPAQGAGLQYGLNVFVGGRHAQVFNQVRDLSFGWQKSLIRWRDVEGAAKRRFDWTGTDELVRTSQAAGLRMLARVDFQPGWARADGANNGPPDNYQDYADFLHALVSRYRAGSPHGHIDAIEIWNEVNISREWGGRPINQQQAGDYVRLLVGAYDAVKRADPSVVVVSAGLSPTGTNTEQAKPDDVYLQWLFDAGMAGHYDVLGAHAPGFKAPPEVSPEQAASEIVWGRHRSFTFRRVEDLRAIMERNGEAGRPIWVTEFGWTSDTLNADYRWFAVSEDAKADYLVRALRWAREHWTDWIGVMFVWNLPDEGWGPRDEAYWWAISDPDGTPRPAYFALRDARRNGSLP